MARSLEDQQAIAESLLGTPFLRLPGDLPEHKVLGRCSDGTPIRVSMVEMVFNDAWFIDQIKGSGTYAASNAGTDERSVHQREVYELAIKLYDGAQPQVPKHRGN